MQLSGKHKKSIRNIHTVGFVNILFGFLLFCMGMTAGQINPAKAQAAGANVIIATKNNTVTQGDTVYILVTVSSSENMKGLEGYFTYDNRYLQFVTGGSVVHGNDDAFQIADADRSSGTTKIKYSIKFKARKKGNTTIALKKPYQVLDEEGNKMSVSYNALNIVVRDKEDATESTKPKEKATETPKKSEKKPSKSKKDQTPKETPLPTPKKSDIVGSEKLRKITLKDVELAPEFDPDIEKYSGMTKGKTEKLSISYEAEDSGAKVKVVGNEKLKEGKNVIKVVVTARTGIQKTYRFSIRVQEGETTSNRNKISLVKEGKKQYLVSSTQVELMNLPKGEDIPEGFEKSQMEIDGKKITVYTLKSGTDHDFVLIYGKALEEGFYLYDTNEQNLILYDKVKSWYRSGTQDTDLLDQAQRTVESYKYVIGIMAVLCLLVIVGATGVVLKVRNQ